MFLPIHNYFKTDNGYDPAIADKQRNEIAQIEQYFVTYSHTYSYVFSIRRLLLLLCYDLYHLKFLIKYPMV